MLKSVSRSLRVGVVFIVVVSVGCPVGPVQTVFGPLDLPHQGYELGFPGPYETAARVVQFDKTYPPVFVFWPLVEPPEEGFPVAIFSPGWNQPKATYVGYGTQLAQWGYVAVIRSHPSFGLWFIGDDMTYRHVQEVSDILDWLEEENTDGESPIYGMVDADRVGIIGHSFGTGPTFYAAVGEPRVDAAVLLDATHVVLDEGGGDVAERDVAFLAFGVDEGGWCSQAPAGARRVLDVAGGPCTEVIIAGADHMDFMDDLYGPVFLVQPICGMGSADSQDVRDITARYLIAWLNVHLKGLSEYEEYYNGVHAAEDVAAGLVQIEHRVE